MIEVRVIDQDVIGAIYLVRRQVGDQALRAIQPAIVKDPDTIKRGQRGLDQGFSLDPLHQVVDHHTKRGRAYGRSRYQLACASR